MIRPWRTGLHRTKLSLFFFLPLVFHVLPNRLTKDARNIPQTHARKTFICAPSLTLIFLFTTCSNDHKTGHNQLYVTPLSSFCEDFAVLLLAREMYLSHCALINIHGVGATLNSKLRRPCSKLSRLIRMPELCSCILSE